MSESRHTPGPWVVTTDLRQDDEIICDMLNEKGYVAITKGQKLANWRADAKLIAAAPDLLKALERIARPHDCGCVPCTGSCTSEMALQITVDEMRELARDAIAKATA